MMEEITKQWSGFIASTVKEVGLIFLKIKHHQGDTIPKELLEEILTMSCKRADELVNLMVDTEILAEMEKDNRKKELIKKREECRKKREAYLHPYVDEEVNTQTPAPKQTEEEQP